MYKVLVFAGTTEGYEICRFLADHKIETKGFVATEYGSKSLTENEFLTVQTGRLDAADMEEVFLQEKPEMVLDATHPYAAEVTVNIRTACEKTQTAYYRVLREAGEHEDRAVYVDSVQAAADYLDQTQGNVLLTTGSKELAGFTGMKDYQNRLYARVLSLPNVMKACAELGFEGKHLIGMQGPFSRELNAAMLRQYDCRYLVTKDTGKAGGFQDKIDAALECDAVPVIIGRPLKEEGMSVRECKRFLTEHFSLAHRPHITLLGIGMGSQKLLTVQGKNSLEQADLLIGARRMLQSVKTEGKAVFESYKPDEIAAYLAEHPQYETAAVLLSGDIGFYSGAKKLYDAIERTEGLEQMEIYPVSGISSVVYFCGKLGVSWEDVHLLSLHGRKQNLIDAVKYHEKVFVLCGEKDGIPKICCKLKEYGLGDVKVAVGTDLSYEQERIVQGTAESLMKEDFAPLSVLLICNPDVKKRIGHGLDDDLFLRGKVPMTKSEVRSISLSKLRLHKDAVVWDVGAGTGSVSIEAASLAKDGVVYAIEKKDEAIDLLEQNKRKFGTDNLEIIKGLAPEALEGLPAPTHAFIGGSSGNLKEILEVLLEQNPRVRVVINAIALETVAEAMQCLKSMAFTDVDIAQVSVAKGKKLGSYEMMMGQNPVYIFSCTGGEIA